MKLFNKIVAVYREILSFAGGFFFLAFCFCVLVQIIARNLLPSAPSWTEEAARYTFIYMVAFGSAVAMLKDEFVYVEFLRDSLEAKGHHRVNQVTRLLITLAIFILCVYILFFSEPAFAFLKFRMVSTAMQIPMQYIYFSQILMFLLLSISAFFRVIMFIRDWNKTGKENTMEQEIQDVIEQTGEAH